MSYGPEQTIEEGFNKFVIKNPEGCWGWSGCAPKNPGYGQFRYSMKLIRAHRASWIIHNGEIPKGMCVLHKCDNKLCSKPEHLFIGTVKDNNLDMIEKGYHPTIGKKGEENIKAKFNKNQIQQIRDLRLAGYRSKEIAEMYDTHYVHVSNITRYTLWKELS